MCINTKCINCLHPSQISALQIIAIYHHTRANWITIHTRATLLSNIITLSARRHPTSITRICRLNTIKRLRPLRARKTDSMHPRFMPPFVTSPGTSSTILCASIHICVFRIAANINNAAFFQWVSTKYYCVNGPYIYPRARDDRARHFMRPIRRTLHSARICDRVVSFAIKSSAEGIDDQSADGCVLFASWWKPHRNIYLTHQNEVANRLKVDFTFRPNFVSSIFDKWSKPVCEEWCPKTLFK